MPIINCIASPLTGEPIAKHVEGLVYRGGGGPLVGREPLARDEGRGGHDCNPGDPVEDGAGVTTEVSSV